MAQMVEQKRTQEEPPAVSSPKPATGTDGSRLVVFLHSLAFVIGFTAVFVLFGFGAGLLGRALNPYMPAIQRLGAIMLVIFGLTTLGVFRWLVRFIGEKSDLDQNPAAQALVNILNFFNTLLYTEKRVTQMHEVKLGWGYLSSALLGVSFSAGWVPCIGPILASIILVASDSATAMQGAMLLAIYSLGLGIPFLITGAAFSSATRFLRRMNRYANVVSIISGLFLLYVAYLLWSDSLVTLTAQFSFLNEWVFAIEDWISIVSGTGGDIVSLSVLAAAPLAFSAGLISFISPCVLPLVPAYIGYLSSAALNSGRNA